MNFSSLLWLHALKKHEFKNTHKPKNFNVNFYVKKAKNIVKHAIRP